MGAEVVVLSRTATQLKTKMKLLVILGLAALCAAWDNHPDCGLSKYPDAGADRTSSRIIGGWEVLPNEYPYQASLRFASGSQFCGGSLMSASKVITAAHCYNRPINTRVGLGEHERRFDSAKMYTITEFLEHPDYDDDTIEHDIAVITLTESVELSENIRPVCAADKPGNADVYAGQRLIVSGFGTTGGFFPRALQAVDVYGMTFDECKDTKIPEDEILEGMMCAAANPGERKDSCSGDSGGPIVYKEGERFELVGVVSWGYGCARGRDWPGVYADGLHYRDWVKEV